MIRLAKALHSDENYGDIPGLVYRKPDGSLHIGESVSVPPQQKGRRRGGRQSRLPVQLHILFYGGIIAPWLPQKKRRIRTP